MAWPSAAIEYSALDQGSDTVANARPQLLTALQQLEVIRLARGQADGIASLDANGQIPEAQFNATRILNKLLTVDGPSSGLNADLLDGLDSTDFLLLDGTNYPITTETSGWRAQRTTATNNARARTLTLATDNSPGATAAGYGGEIRALLGNASGIERSAASLAWDWLDATNLSEDSALVFSTSVAGTLTEACRWIDRKLQIAEQTTPASQPPTGSWWLYMTATGLAVMDDAGVEVVLGGAAGTDHGGLTGLTDDDHTIYLRTDGSRVLTGQLQTGANAILTTDLGGDPAAPAAGKVLVYTKGGALYYQTPAGTVVGPIIAGGVTDHGALTGNADDDHTQYLLRQPAADVVINDSGGDFNFRIESTTEARLFATDAGENCVTIAALAGVPTGSNGRFQVLADTVPGIYISATGAGSKGLVIAGASALAIDAAVTTSADVGVAAFTRTSGADPTAAVLTVTEANATFGALCLYVDQSAAAKPAMRVDVALGEVFSVGATELAINESGASYDLRVEGDTATNLLFVDASEDRVNINGTLTNGRLNVSSSGTDTALYVTCTGSGTVAEFFSTDGPGLSVVGTGGTGLGGGITCLSARNYAANFAKFLGAFSPSEAFAVKIAVQSATDSAHALWLDQRGTGDFLHCENAALVFSLPVGGGSYWLELGADPSTPTTAMWGLYFKSDGLYYIDDTGAVTGPLGSGGGGGVVTSAFGAIRQPDHYEEEITTSTAVSFVDTTIAAPAGCYIERVLTRVTAAVSGGYHVGTVGSATRWGDTLGGNVGDTNLTYARTPAPMATGDDAVTIRISHPSGNFATNTGKVRVTVFFVRFTAATS